MGYYERVADTRLADDFKEELFQFFRSAAKDPATYNFRIGDLRRVNLKRFPYNFWFRATADTIRILVVRHHAKRPSFGLARR